MVCRMQKITGLFESNLYSQKLNVTIKKYFSNGRSSINNSYLVFHLKISFLLIITFFVVACNLNPDRGGCKAVIQRYYFDKITQSCRAFMYGGCEGNENNFRSKEACETVCDGKKITDDDYALLEK